VSNQHVRLGDPHPHRDGRRRRQPDGEGPARGADRPGKFTEWRNDNLTKQNQNSSFTFDGPSTSSDGSFIAWHDNAHVSTSPGDVPQASFEKAPCR